MIEIIFDRNTGDVFLDEQRPVFVIDKQKAADWRDYRKLALDILRKHQNDRIVIVRNLCQDISVNWLAVALFVEACFEHGSLEAVVFKGKNYEEMLNAYKPFVALTIGIKYVIRLYQIKDENIYKDISGLSYLGISVNEDYLRNKLVLKLNRGGNVRQLTAQTPEETLIAVGIIKTLALSSLKVSAEADIAMVSYSEITGIGDIIEKIVNYVRPLLGSE